MNKNKVFISSREQTLLRRHLAIEAFTVFRQKGRTPFPDELARGKKYNQTPFAGFFGSYAAFCREMDFDFFNFKTGEPVTEKKFIEIIRRVSTVIGQSPTMSEFELITSLTLKDVKKHFRNFSRAIAAADLQLLITRSSKYSDHRLLQILKDIGKSAKRLPHQSDIRKLGMPKVKIYVKRFGSFRKAVIAAGFTVPVIPKAPSPYAKRKVRISKLLKELSK